MGADHCRVSAYADWGPARVADSKLYDFLLFNTGEDALVLVEQYEGMGFETWRQLNKRFNPSGGNPSLT